MNCIVGGGLRCLRDGAPFCLLREDLAPPSRALSTLVTVSDDEARWPGLVRAAKALVKDRRVAVVMGNDCQGADVDHVGPVEGA